MAHPSADTRLQRRYRYGEDICPVSHGAPLWTASGPHPQGVALHDHDFLEIELVDAGSAEHVTIHGRERVSAGCVSVLHPGQWHGYERARGLVLRDVYFDLGLFTRELAWLRDDPRLWPLMPLRMPRDDRERRSAPQGVLTLRLAPAALTQVRHACDAIAAFATGDGVQRRGILVGLALQLCELLADHPTIARRAMDPIDPRVAQALAAMACDLRRVWSLEALSRQAGMSVPHLTRCVRRATGMSPMRWLAQRRAERLAVLLLRDHRPIALLGREVGWDDPSYCARRFRACFGCTPDTYRRRGPGWSADREDPPT